MQRFVGASALLRTTYTSQRRIPSRFDAGAEERGGSGRQVAHDARNAYNYASKSEDAAFLMVFGSICARSAEVLVY